MSSPPHIRLTIQPPTGNDKVETTTVLESFLAGYAQMALFGNIGDKTPLDTPAVKATIAYTDAQPVGLDFPTCKYGLPSREGRHLGEELETFVDGNPAQYFEELTGKLDDVHPQVLTLLTLTQDTMEDLSPKKALHVYLRWIGAVGGLAKFLYQIVQSYGHAGRSNRRIPRIEGFTTEADFATLASSLTRTADDQWRAHHSKGADGELAWQSVAPIFESVQKTLREFGDALEPVVKRVAETAKFFVSV